MSTRALLLFAALAAAAGCRPSLPGSYQCTTSSQCAFAGAQGVCEPSGACSFPDVTCPSGRRYGQYGPPGLAGACVDPSNSGPLDLSLPARDADAGSGGVITRVGATKLAPSARTQALALPAPAGLAAGDFVLACLYAADPKATFTPAADWTQHLSISDGLTGTFHAAWYTHLAAAGEPPGYVFMIDNPSGSAVAAALVAYRGVAPAAPIDTADSRLFTGAPFVAPSVTTTHAGDMLVAMFVNQTQSLILKAPNGMGTAVEDQVIYFFDALQPTLGPSGPKATNNALPGLGAVDFVALSPAP